MYFKKKKLKKNQMLPGSIFWLVVTAQELQARFFLV